MPTAALPGFPTIRLREIAPSRLRGNANVLTGFTLIGLGVFFSTWLPISGEYVCFRDDLRVQDIAHEIGYAVCGRQSQAVGLII
jgi:hypothetical protein